MQIATFSDLFFYSSQHLLRKQGMIDILATLLYELSYKIIT